MPSAAYLLALGAPLLHVINHLPAYAAYFDHRRRTDANFRRALKRESKKEARIARSKAEEQTTQQKTAIKEAVAAAKEEGFPDNVEEREAYFMEMVSQGEVLSQQGSTY